MKKIKQHISERIEELIEAEVEAEDVEIPDNPEHGDFAYPAMKAASELGESPRDIAERLADGLEGSDFVAETAVAGPGYVNITVEKEFYAGEVEESLKSERFGVEERSGNVLVEFSSPNVAKPMHIGHFRNNALGDSLQRILDFVGYDVTGENYLGDWGTQYGKLIHAFKQFGSEQEFEKDPMEHMFDLYVKFHDEMEDDEEMAEKGQEWAAKIEEGDEEAVELWEMFRDASIEYHKQDYERMGIEFDRWTGESTVVDESRRMVEEWLEEGLLERDDDGSVFIEFEDLPGTVLLKDDGSTLYITRDLYNLKKRNEEGFNHNLYVVGSEQDLHFKQVFAAADRMGLDPEGSEHVSYGMLSLPEGSMSSRKGRIIRLEDALDEAVEKAREKTADRDIENAEEVGIGAVKYANLSVSRKKDIEFSWDRALSFEGDSGPYLQYSNTRAKSILEEVEEDGKLAGELQKEEYRLLKKLGEFPERIEAAADQREPAKIANYLSSLCEEFNSFYHSKPVKDASKEDRVRRTRLVSMFVDVTDTGLELLGIEPLDEM